MSCFLFLILNTLRIRSQLSEMLKLFISTTLLVFITSNVSSAEPYDQRHFQYIDQIEEIATPPETAAALTTQELKSHLMPFTSMMVPPDVIINAGLKIWEIIVENKAVINIESNYANALPAGIKNASELQNFSPIQYKSFRRRAKNFFGATAYDVTYTIIHRYGGDMNGIGKYIESVGIIPHKVNVTWGYKLDFKVVNTATVNLGTTQEPIASLLMDVAMDVTTIFSKRLFRTVYEFRGDSPTVRTIEG